MLLSDGTLRKLIEDDTIHISPTPEWDSQLQPASLDIRIGDWYLNKDTGEEFEDSEYLIIEPGVFYLATTMEYVGLPADITATVSGRSSIGRKGMLIHVTAGIIDAGYEGEITLEVYNLSKDTLYIKPGARVGQLLFQQMDKPAERPYGEKSDAKYQGQRGPTNSLVEEEYVSTEPPEPAD